MHHKASQTGAKPIARPYMRGAAACVDLYTPEQAVRCKDIEDLHFILRFFGRDSQLDSITDGSIAGHRHYVEKIRPALRWYCNHWKVPIPPWLVDNVAERYSKEEQERLFGPKPLKVIEFERHVPQAPPEVNDKPKPSTPTSAAGTPKPAPKPAPGAAPAAPQPKPPPKGA